MVTTRTDYTADTVAAARSVLLELAHLLGEYRNDIVVVGGWVPELLLAHTSTNYIGSMDVDLALNHRSIRDTGYRTIQQHLLTRGYRQGKQPFIYHRSVPGDAREYIVQVDFLAGEYEGTGGGHRTQPVQDVRARKARGCDLAFENATEVVIHGTLPYAGEDSAAVLVASIVSFIAMKGMALHDRLKEKDAWDIDFCVQNYPGGLDTLVQEILPRMGNRLILESLLKIAEKFASPTHVGPKFVADFDGLTDAEERALRQRDTYEKVNYLMEKLGIT